MADLFFYPDDDYVLNHATKYLARFNTDRRHSYGLHGSEAPRDRIAEAWRFPLIDTYGGGAPGISAENEFNSYNAVTFIYAGADSQSAASIEVIRLQSLGRSVSLLACGEDRSDAILRGGLGAEPCRRPVRGFRKKQAAHIDLRKISDRFGKIAGGEKCWRHEVWKRVGMHLCGPECFVVQNMDGFSFRRIASPAPDTLR